MYSETELTKQRLIQLKNNTDPQKWVFIQEIKTLAEQHNDYSHSTLEAILRNSQKTIQELFYIKYELSLTGLIVTDLLINFRDISKSDLLTEVKNRELDAELQRPIIAIYLKKIEERQIFEKQAFDYIRNNIHNRELLVQMLENFICQSVAYSVGPESGYVNAQVQPNPNVISNLSIEAHMNVYNQAVDPRQVPAQSQWMHRNYLRENQKNVTHVQIAYFINQQITKQENRDPLEYFEHYRKTNNE